MTNQKKFVYIRYTSIALFVLAGGLSMLYDNNSILSIQLYTRIAINSLLYMLAIFLLFISFFSTDVGFFKLSLGIGLIIITYAFILSNVHNRIRYQLLEGEGHRIIVEYTVHQDNTSFYFYSRDNFMVYTLFGEAPNPNTYETELSIENDQIVLENCDESSCYTVYVDIE